MCDVSAGSRRIKLRSNTCRWPAPQVTLGGYNHKLRTLLDAIMDKIAAFAVR